MGSADQGETSGGRSRGSTVIWEGGSTPGVVCRNDHLKSLRMTTIFRACAARAPASFPSSPWTAPRASPSTASSTRDFARRSRAPAARRPAAAVHAELAAELGISRIPVLQAFEQLLAEGYFESRRGAGTFVAGVAPGRSPHRSGRALARIRTGRAPEGDFTQVPQLMLDGPRALAARPRPLQRQPAAVDRFPCSSGRGLVARRSRQLDASCCTTASPWATCPSARRWPSICAPRAPSAATRARSWWSTARSRPWNLTARALLDPGQSAWIEEPGYFGAQNALRMAGARLVPVPVDDDGLDVEAGIARSPQAQAAYVTPSHQFPLGVTMSASRRLQLLDWAQTTGAWIIEDDYDSEYRYGSLPISVAAGARPGPAGHLHRDIEQGSVSGAAHRLHRRFRATSSSASRRSGRPWTSFRRPSIRRCSRTSSARGTSPVTSGGCGCSARAGAPWSRRCERNRRRARVLGDPAGLYLTATLPAGVDDRAIAEQAARQGLWAMPLSACSRPARRTGLVLGYGGTSADGDPRRRPPASRRVRGDRIPLPAGARQAFPHGRAALRLTPGTRAQTFRTTSPPSRGTPRPSPRARPRAPAPRRRPAPRRSRARPG